jgi:hypothetical protein
MNDRTPTPQNATPNPQDRQGPQIEMGLVIYKEIGSEQPKLELIGQNQQASILDILGLADAFNYFIDNIKREKFGSPELQASSIIGANLELLRKALMAGDMEMLKGDAEQTPAPTPEPPIQRVPQPTVTPSPGVVMEPIDEETNFPSHELTQEPAAPRQPGPVMPPRPVRKDPEDNK